MCFVVYLSQFLAVGRVGSEKEFKKISKVRRKNFHDLCSGAKQRYKCKTTRARSQ